jgi:ribosome-binding protein aMBF1 (putative translation factor)
MFAIKKKYFDKISEDNIDSGSYRKKLDDSTNFDNNHSIAGTQQKQNSHHNYSGSNISHVRTRSNTTVIRSDNDLRIDDSFRRRTLSDKDLASRSSSSQLNMQLQN